MPTNARSCLSTTTRASVTAGKPGIGELAAEARIGHHGAHVFVAREQPRPLPVPQGHGKNRLRARAPEHTAAAVAADQCGGTGSEADARGREA